MPRKRTRQKRVKLKSEHLPLLLTFFLVASCAIDFSTPDDFLTTDSLPSISLISPPPIHAPNLEKRQSQKTQETLDIAKNSGQIANPRKISKAQKSPNDLLGLNALEVAKLLGTPNLLRREYPAEIWQYHNQDCVLDIFLYPAKHAAPIVTYFETRDRTLSQLKMVHISEQNKCFQQIASLP